jgi:hypothetical protein
MPGIAAPSGNLEFLEIGLAVISDDLAFRVFHIRGKGDNPVESGSMGSGQKYEEKKRKDQRTFFEAGNCC